MRRTLYIMLTTMVLALLAVAATAQETTTEPPLPTVEVTVELTAEPTAPATSSATAEATAETTAEATMQPTSAATAQATADVAVTAEVTTTPGDNNAYLRVAHLASEGGSVDAYLNDTLTVGSLTFPSVSEWIPLTPGSYTITVAPSGEAASAATFAPLTVSAAANTWQTVAIIGAGGGLQASVISEDYRELLPSTGGFTFFNALEGSAPVNLMRDGVAYYAQIGFPGQDVTSSSSLRSDSGVFDVQAVDPNEPTNVIAETTALELPENAYTLVALVGPQDSPSLFTFVTDESAVEIARGLLPKPGTLIDALRANSNLTAFADALATADLNDMLTDKMEYTIFAPANFAIDGSDTITAEEAATLLRSYIVEGKYTKNEFLEAGTLTALDGTTLTFTTGAEGIYVNGVLVIDVNIAATNGVIHMIRARWDSEEATQ